ncbi:MAG TPA: AAA family ATPase [Thermoleophilia bacterium]|nr:AAA family ATPase [Thermoleophilia bacterium]
MTAEPFPVVRMAEASSCLGAPRWLVEPLWAAGGAGVLGAQPKAGKTFLALDIAVSVASGTPCLDTFRVCDPGPVLLFLAEDSAHSAYERVSSICHHRNVDLASLDLFLLTTPVLRLDVPQDAQRLAATVAKVRPRLLVLDPFVRVQAIEENSASEVSRLLADLTALKRTFDLAILLVHHVRKNGSGHPGQTLRGSGDLRAWGDSNLYLKHHGDRLELSGEHRAAPAIEPVSVKLVTNRDGSCPRLAVVGEPEPQGPQPTLLSRLLGALERSDAPLTRTALRQLLEVNNQRLGDALAHLERSGHILRGADGWRPSTPFRSLPLGEGRNGTAVDSSPAPQAAPAAT